MQHLSVWHTDMHTWQLYAQTEHEVSGIKVKILGYSVGTR